MTRTASPTQHSPNLQVDPGLAEAAVEARLRGPGDLLQKRLAVRYRRAADRIYGSDEGRAREAAFREVYAGLFDDLGYQDALRSALAAFPALTRGLQELVVTTAKGRTDEGSDLAAGHGETRPKPAAVLRMLPHRFLDGPALDAFLRFNFWQIQDLLNPAFGFDGRGLPYDTVPAEARLVLEAYGLLWALYTGHRLQARGWAVPAEHASLRQDLRHMVGPGGQDVADAVLSRIDTETALTHDALLGLARELRAAARVGRVRRIEVCDLCGFASVDVRPLSQVDQAARDMIAAEYPDRGDLVCGHCAERMALLAPPAGVVSGASATQGDER